MRGNPKEGLRLAAEIEAGLLDATGHDLDFIAALRECQTKAMSYRARIKRLMLDLHELRPATDDEINRSFDAYR